MSSPVAMPLQRLTVRGVVGVGRGMERRKRGSGPVAAPVVLGPRQVVSSLALVAGLSNVQIWPGARAQPQDRTLKSNMRKRPVAESKEPPSLEWNQ